MKLKSEKKVEESFFYQLVGKKNLVRCDNVWLSILTKKSKTISD